MSKKKTKNCTIRIQYKYDTIVQKYFPEHLPRIPSCDCSQEENLEVRCSPVNPYRAATRRDRRLRRLEDFSARWLATWISIVIIYIVRFLFSHRFTFYILHFYSNERVKFFPRAYGTLS